MRGISKEIPWPGSRCGWIEIYNKNKNKQFQKYIDTILKAKRLEVCSTTLPQMSIPPIFNNPKYKKHLKDRTLKFYKRAQETIDIFKNKKGINPIKPKGAFYMTILFDENLMNSNQTLHIENKKIKERIESLCSSKHIENDKRFVYYLLGSTGIITVPLTSFYSKRKGIRITLLEDDDKKRISIFKAIRDKMIEYLNSTN